MSGFSSTGLTIKTIQEIVAEIGAELLATVDPALDLSPDQPLGQIVGIFAQREAKLWELLATVTDAINPDAAEDFLADSLCALTGTVREPAKKSTVSLNCVVGASFTASAGQMMANVSGQDTVRFVNVDAVGPLTAGTHAIDFQSVDYGAVSANAGTLTVITAPVSGWTSCTNPLDATLGSDIENDADLMVRREEELAASGACTVDSIRADVLQIEGVQQCFVFENTTLETDSDGLPGKAIEVVIFDGTSPAADDDEVAQKVWDSKPSGSQAYGSTSGTATDTQGVERTVAFSRATVKNVYLEFDVTIDVTEFPTDGADQIKDAVADYGDSKLNLGIDVVAVKMKAAALAVPGVLDITALRLGFSASPVGTSNLTITGREIASLDTSRITVATTPGTP